VSNLSINVSRQVGSVQLHQLNTELASCKGVLNVASLDLTYSDRGGLGSRGSTWAQNLSWILNQLKLLRKLLCTQWLCVDLSHPCDSSLLQALRHPPCFQRFGAMAVTSCNPSWWFQHSFSSKRVMKTEYSLCSLHLFP
jgi:hypothetical protein